MKPESAKEMEGSERDKELGPGSLLLSLLYFEMPWQKGQGPAVNKSVSASEYHSEKVAF